MEGNIRLLYILRPPTEVTESDFLFPFCGDER